MPAPTSVKSQKPDLSAHCHILLVILLSSRDDFQGTAGERALELESLLCWRRQPSLNFITSSG